jgi:raffinose/stachyose/melibiose transport system permease protein
LEPPAPAPGRPGGQAAVIAQDPSGDGVMSGARRGRRPTPAGVAGRRRHNGVAITLFMAPALVLFITFVAAPIAVAMYTSLFKWNGFGLPEDFVSLDNYTRLAEDEVFRGDLKRGAILIVLSLIIQLPMALGLALLLNQPLRGRSLYRVLFFAPYVLSEVTTGVLFSLVFSPNQGLANQLTGWLGLGEDRGDIWLANENVVLYTLFFVITWKYFGFHMILYLAGRQNIPNEITEAAAVDGAGAWKTFRYITLPLLGPTIRISVFLSVIGAIQLFDMVWVLTLGGPIHASETMAVTMFQFGFRRFEVGYASAISVSMFLISLVFALLYQRFVLRRDIEGAVTNMGNQR